MVKRSGKWARVSYDPAPVNLLHEWVGKRIGTNVQFLQTLSFDPTTGLLGVYLPGVSAADTKVDQAAGSEKKGKEGGVLMGRLMHPDASSFKYLLLVDVQQCTVVSKPVDVQLLRLQSQ
jgi:hypothetical protein